MRYLIFAILLPVALLAQDGNAAKGKELYIKEGYECHGYNGQGGQAPASLRR